MDGGLVKDHTKIILLCIKYNEGLKAFMNSSSDMFLPTLLPWGMGLFFHGDNL